MMNSFYDILDEITEIYFGHTNYCDQDKKIAESIKKSVKTGMTTNAPKYVMMKVSNKCNSKCYYCNHASNKEGIEEKNEISTELLKRAIQQASQMGVKAMTLSGGEPLLRNDIPELVSYMISNKIVPVLLTNGFGLKDQWRELGDSGLKFIIISIDSFDEKVYRLQRGMPFHLAKQAIESAKLMMEHYKGVKIHVTPVVTKYNIREIPEFIRILSKEGISVQLSPYHHFAQTTKNIFSIDDSDMINDVVNELIEMKKNGYKIANTIKFIEHLPKFYTCDKKVPDDHKCLTGYLAIFIDAYMNVRACWSNNYSPLGNIQNESLIDIWFSDRYNQIRQEMFNCNCEGCWYLCTGDLTLFFNERGCIYDGS